MKQKIFNSAILTIVMLIGIHGTGMSQGMLPEQQKNLELKLQTLELKMKELQARLDSMKLNQKLGKLQGLTFAYKDFDNFAPLTRMPRMPKMPPMPDIGEKFNQTFKGFENGMNFNFSDKNLQDKIKNGEVKELTKSYTKSYNVDRNDKLVIDNKFGKVTVNTWNKNEIKVDVEIKADANDDAEAKKLLDGISITDSKDGSIVNFKTNINSNGNDSWGSWTNGSNNSVRKIEINYTVYMPSRNSLEITNRFGGTEIPDFDGKLTINSSFGSFNAKVLSNPQNDITSRYGSTTIGSLNGSSLKVGYGSLDLGSSDNLNADISYSSAKIGSIKTSGVITVRYSGGLKIGDLDKNFKNLDVTSSYSSVSLGLPDNPNCDFNVSVHYGSFNYGTNNVTVTNKTPDDNERGWNPTKTYKGYIGKGNSDKTVTIKSTYGSVKFINNKQNPSSL